MANYLTNDTDLTSVANAIRTKSGTSASLIYPTGFVSAINNIIITPPPIIGSFTGGSNTITINAPTGVNFTNYNRIMINLGQDLGYIYNNFMISVAYSGTTPYMEYHKYNGARMMSVIAYLSGNNNIRVTFNTNSVVINLGISSYSATYNYVIYKV